MWWAGPYYGYAQAPGRLWPAEPRLPVYRHPGTGKTDLAKILSRAVNCEHPVDGNPCNSVPSCLGVENGSILDVLELDAASNNGVDQVRAPRTRRSTPRGGKQAGVHCGRGPHTLHRRLQRPVKILEEPRST